MEDWTKSLDIQMIVQFVEWFRHLTSTTPTPGYKPELSCFMFGEWHNLLFRQLVLTTQFDGGWLELKNSPEIMTGVKEEIAKTIEGFIRSGQLDLVVLPLWSEAVVRVLS